MNSDMADVRLVGSLDFSEDYMTSLVDPQEMGMSKIQTKQYV